MVQNSICDLRLFSLALPATRSKTLLMTDLEKMASFVLSLILGPPIILLGVMAVRHSRDRISRWGLGLRICLGGLTLIFIGSVLILWSALNLVSVLV